MNEVIRMEEYTDVFGYDNSEPQDAWWNEDQGEYVEYEGFEGTVSGNVISDTQDVEMDSTHDGVSLYEIIESMNYTSNFGTMGDYYNQQLGCYVFPSYEVYEYFIDTDAYGGEWTETSDGHYVPVQYLEAYEGYVTTDEDTEPFLTESELQSIETLESIRGILSVIKENNTTFYETVYDCQQETLETLQEISMKEEGVLYGTIVECVLLAATLGTCLAHIFFGRMRVG